MWMCVMKNESVKRKTSVIMGKWKWKKKRKVKEGRAMWESKNVRGKMNMA